MAGEITDEPVGAVKISPSTLAPDDASVVSLVPTTTNGPVAFVDRVNEPLEFVQVQSSDPSSKLLLFASTKTFARESGPSKATPEIDGPSIEPSFLKHPLKPCANKTSTAVEVLLFKTRSYLDFATSFVWIFDIWFIVNP